MSKIELVQTHLDRAICTYFHINKSNYEQFLVVEPGLDSYSIDLVLTILDTRFRLFDLQVGLYDDDDELIENCVKQILYSIAKTAFFDNALFLSWQDYLLDLHSRLSARNEITEMTRFYGQLTGICFALCHDLVSNFNYAENGLFDWLFDQLYPGFMANREINEEIFGRIENLELILSTIDQETCRELAFGDPLLLEETVVVPRSRWLTKHLTYVGILYVVLNQLMLFLLQMDVRFGTQQQSKMFVLINLIINLRD